MKTIIGIYVDNTIRVPRDGLYFIYRYILYVYH